MSQVEKKLIWVALLLNFLLPGVGHVYAGQGSKGAWLIVGNVLSYALIIPTAGASFLGAIGTWIYALATSASAVNEAADERISAKDFAKALGSALQLLQSGLIDQDEFDARKAKVIASLSEKELDGDPDTILLAVAPLKKQELITDDDLAMIKLALAGKG